jgi:hypothetical protein
MRPQFTEKGEEQALLVGGDVGVHGGGNSANSADERGWNLLLSGIDPWKPRGKSSADRD